MPYASQRLIEGLRQGKTALRLARRDAPLDEKLRDLVRAQQMYAEIVAARRPLKPSERPWDILSDVREAVILSEGMVGSQKASVFSASSDWVRPPQPWILTL